VKIEAKCPFKMGRLVTITVPEVGENGFCVVKRIGGEERQVFLKECDVNWCERNWRRHEGNHPQIEMEGRAVKTCAAGVFRDEKVKWGRRGGEKVISGEGRKVIPLTDTRGRKRF